MNTITIDLTSEGLEPLQKKEEGDTCDLSSCKFTVLKNDGTTLVGELTDVEIDESHYDEAKEAMEGDDKEEPVAVVALGVGKKK